MKLHNEVPAVVEAERRAENFAIGENHDAVVVSLHALRAFGRCLSMILIGVDVLPRFIVRGNEATSFTSFAEPVVMHVFRKFSRLRTHIYLLED